MSKIGFYRSILSELEISLLSLNELPLLRQIHVEEDLYDITANSIKKATIYAAASGLTTLSDDTAIFIPALKNQPGVAVRRWAGELPESISDEDWSTYFMEKTKDMPEEQLYCYKYRVVCISLPDGHHREITNMVEGKIVRDNPHPAYMPGGPFGAYFYISEFGKFESELTNQERQRHARSLKENIVRLLTTFDLVVP